jgi:hypothetical protein
MSSDYNEDRAYELGDPTMTRYLQEDEEEWGAETTRTGALDMQVCVPKDWTDEQVKEFADLDNPCGTINGWFIRKQGDKALAGADERVPCSDRKGFVHVMLDA